VNGPCSGKLDPAYPHFTNYRERRRERQSVTVWESKRWKRGERGSSLPFHCRPREELSCRERTSANVDKRTRREGEKLVLEQVRRARGGWVC